MENDIYHFGIKGMKWGKRRYQNKDGSLTAAGKQRYSNMEKDRASSKRSTISDMSDDDLRKRINRLNLEKQYKQLLNEGISDDTTQVKAGKNYLKSFASRSIKSVIQPAVEDIGRQVVRSKLADFTNKAFKFEGDKMVFANNKKK